MSILVGAIAAAGWKGFIQAKLGKTEWGPKLPEALLPLPNDETVLSRAARQLREAGAIEVFVAVGVPGKSSPRFERWVQTGGYDGYKNKDAHFDVEIGAEIWTRERLEYVAGLGYQIISMPDFDTAIPNYTVACLLQAILDSRLGFDKVLVTMGDYVMTDQALEKVLALECPCMWCPIPWHQAWLLDVMATTWLAEYLLTAKSVTPKEWQAYQEKMKNRGLAIVDNLFPSMKDFVEIECPTRYEYARKIASRK